MSAQVDVLAVLDATIRTAKSDAQARGSYEAAKAAVVFEEARAAVAALIAERDALRKELSGMTELAMFLQHRDEPIHHQPAPVVFRNNGNSEADFIAHHADACTACGGSGHKSDQQPAPVVDDARMARALEWVRTNAAFEFPHIREHLPAIEEAIAAYDPNCGGRTVRGVDDAMVELIDAADKAKRAYWLARNSAAGLTNYCEESANSRRCERELDEAERIYRDSGFEAALARAQGVQS